MNMSLFRLFCVGVVFLMTCGLSFGEEAISFFEGAPTLKSFFEYQIYGFDVAQLSESFLIVILTMIFRTAIARSIFRYFIGRTERNHQPLRNALLAQLEPPFSTFILLFGLFLGVKVLPMEGGTAAFVTNVYKAGTMVIIAWGLVRLTDLFIDALTARAKTQKSSLTGFMPLIKKSIKIFIVIVGGLMVIDNLGYKVGGILATLGIGGAAIAFASKDTVANFFGSLCIVLDRPFKVGDWIKIGEKINGDVISIGLRSTRIKTFFATIVSIPNSVLANEVIDNWSRMPKRRVKQNIGLNYGTPPDTMHVIVEDIRKLLREDKDVNQDFIMVNFTDFGESSLDITVYYFTKTTNWLQYLDVRQKINIEIMKIVASRGSSIAFPSRALYFAKTEGGNDASNPLLGRDII